RTVTTKAGADSGCPPGTIPARGNKHAGERPTMTRRARVAARAGATLAVVAASTLMWAAPAHAAAATINVSEAQLSYTAAAGQDNHLIIGNVTGSPDTYVFFEAGGIPITSTDSACWHSDPNYSNIMACT